MNLLVAKLMMSVLLLSIFTEVSSKPLSALRQSSCHVVDEIRMHNSDKAWWWSLQSIRPQVVQNPVNIFAKHSKEWMVFISQHKATKLPVIEIAHKSRNGKCRFVVKKQNGQGIGFSLKKKCQAGVTGQKGLFRASLESLTDRVQISFGTRHVSHHQKKFLGFDGDRLVLSTLRHKNMSWWTIDFNKSKRC